MSIGMYKALAVLLLMLGVTAGTWFAADAHYSKQYETLTGELMAQAAAQKKQVAATIAANKAEDERINNEANDQIARMSDTIADLSVRLNASRGSVRLCPTAPSPVKSDAAADGRTTPAGAGATQNATGPSVAIDGQVLLDALDTGIDALSAEILWRDYARSMGQVK